MCRLCVAEAPRLLPAVSLSPLQSILDVSCVRDIVSVENTASFPSIDRHDDSFVNSGTYFITSARPSQGVNYPALKGEACS